MPDTPDDLPAVWRDNLKRQWTCRLDVPMVMAFCARRDLSLAVRPGRRRFSVHDLHDGELFELAFLGTRWNAVAQGDKREPKDPGGEETAEEFLAAHADGSAYEDALFAARAAVINFTLRRLDASVGRSAAAESWRSYERAWRAAFDAWRILPPPAPTATDGPGADSETLPGTADSGGGSATPASPA